ncbi:MAG TPA: pseudoazurin [Rhizomicrobium sp.]
MFRFVSAAGALLLSSWLVPAFAADYQIRMLNQGPEGMLQFSPQVLKVEPGDTVHFLAVDKGHNAKSIDGMLPEGAKPFADPIGEDFTVTLSVPGVYGYRCTPHGMLGMVGLIVVGNLVNEQAAKSAAMPGMAGRVFSRLFQSLDSNRTAAK